MGYVPGFAGAHSQGSSLDELRQNLEEVIAMLLEDGEPTLEAQFVGTKRERARIKGPRAPNPLDYGGRHVRFWS